MPHKIQPAVSNSKGRQQEWRVVVLDEDGRVAGSYGQGLGEEMARRVHRFAQSQVGEAAVLQFREPPALSPPWETVAVLEDSDA